MITIDEILKVRSVADFERLALQLFEFQSARCEPYREYISLLEINPQEVTSLKEIPFLPIELFKSHKVYCGEAEPEIIFTSSNTGGNSASKHYMAFKSDYEKTFRRAFEFFYGAPEAITIYGLLPNYLQREGSSLVYMVDDLIKSGGGGFYLDDFPTLIKDIEADPKSKILLGVSYALWDLAEQYAPKLRNTIVMETGGMKGQREEMPKKAFHKMLCEDLGVESIHSEYGMAELSSQGYSFGNGIFNSPPWMKIMIRDLNDPFEMLGTDKSGGVNIIDLANRFSCAFIQTQDIGKVSEDGSFEILGRMDRSEIRGCNLLVQ